jgi:predicted transposase YbfD/YdcC
MVSAWATQNRLVLGQIKVDEKSNEITAIPELLKLLELSGCIVTIDAMGCQQEIVKLITEQNADYIITLKKNQGSLYKNVEQLFKSAIRTDYQGIDKSAYSTREEAHGREDIRHYLMLTGITERIDPNHKWSNLKSIGLVERSRIRSASGQFEL